MEQRLKQSSCFVSLWNVKRTTIKIFFTNICFIHQLNFYKFLSSRTKTWQKKQTCVASINVLWLTAIQFISVFYLPLKLKETSLFTNIVFVIQIMAGINITRWRQGHYIAICEFKTAMKAIWYEQLSQLRNLETFLTKTLVIFGSE